uniref:DUF951 domain-containing protein n=1 Tax=Ndongobacter massiliensis TaxID=1871025 RepID=UPI0009308682|nr:DUF951 domain-containing protein [Ndongobacter massiliensis]
MHYSVGNHVTLKKGHPCGTNEWCIQRTGVEIKLLCCGCGRVIWLKRPAFEKQVRTVRLENGTWRSLRADIAHQ